jgi:SAM-dependent methyltransferase
MSDEVKLDVYIQKKCPLCYSLSVRPVANEQNDFANHPKALIQSFDKSWVQLLECSHCGFAFCKEIPSHVDFFNQRYIGEFDPKIEQLNEFKNVILEDIFDIFKKNNKTTGRLLDIGCFAGIFLQLALKKGFKAEGIEVNPVMAKFASEKLNLKVINVKFDEFVSEDNAFDVITLIDVLEHLVDPRTMLEKCHKLLAPGGILLIKVPNYKPQKFKQKVANNLGISNQGFFGNFGHINQFSPRSLDHVAQEIGMKNISCFVSRSEMWSQSSILNRMKNLLRDVVFWFSKILADVTGINLGLNIIHVSKKL